MNSVLGVLETERDFVEAVELDHHVGLDADLEGVLEHVQELRLAKSAAAPHVHAHASTLMGSAGRDIVPVFSQGHVAHGGIPTWDDPRLVMNDESATALSKQLGKHVACQMRGHGSVAVGATLKQVVLRAIYAEVNARLQSEALRLGAINFLNDAEAANAARTIDSVIDRPWELWLARAARP